MEFLVSLSSRCFGVAGVIRSIMFLFYYFSLYCLAVANVQFRSETSLRSNSRKHSVGGLDQTNNDFVVPKRYNVFYNFWWYFLYFILRLRLHDDAFPFLGPGVVFLVGRVYERIVFFIFLYVFSHPETRRKLLINVMIFSYFKWSSIRELRHRRHNFLLLNFVYPFSLPI